MSQSGFEIVALLILLLLQSGQIQEELVSSLDPGWQMLRVIGDQFTHFLQTSIHDINSTRVQALEIWILTVFNLKTPEWWLLICDDGKETHHNTITKNEFISQMLHCVSNL